MTMDITKIDENFKAQTVITANGKTTYAIPSESFSLHGITYDSQEKRFVRMPLDVAKTVSEGVGYLAKHTAGGRLCFATDSKSLEITVTYSGLEMMQHMPLTGSAGFSLFERTPSGEQFIANLTPCPHQNDGFTAAASLADEKMREYVLYFPLYNNVSSLSVALDEKASVKKGKAYREVLPILYYGSSITQGGCANRPDNAYEALICKKNGIDFSNLGFSGSAKAEKEMIAYLGGLNCSLFVCDYDHNAPNADYLEATHYALYEGYRALRPDTPILFITKPDYTRDSEGERRIKIIRDTYKKAKKAGDKQVFFLSGKRFYGKENCWNFAVEGCHPTDYGFALMAKQIYKKMCEIDDVFKGE